MKSHRKHVKMLYKNDVNQMYLINQTVSMKSPLKILERIESVNSLEQKVLFVYQRNLKHSTDIDGLTVSVSPSLF